MDERGERDHVPGRGAVRARLRRLWSIAVPFLPGAAGDPADAEDALQEVFCKRLYRAPGFPSPEQERRWLFRVAVNQCRDELRRRRRMAGPLPEDLPAPQVTDLGLWERVAALPEKQRTVVHLHYAEGYSVQEIAEVLGVTASAVKMRLARARAALRQAWEVEE